MNWNQIDNKNYRGPLDDRLVSFTEAYEVKYFIDKWLKDNNYTINDNSRDVVWGQMQQYTGRKPVVRTELAAWLQTRISPKR